MKHLSTFIFLCIAFIFNTFAQIGIDLQTYNIGAIPKISVQQDSLAKKFGLCGIEGQTVFHYLIISDHFELWNLAHEAILVYDEESIHNYEKLSIGYLPDEKIVNINIRISKDGKIIHSYTQDDLLNSEEEEGSRYFDLKGITPGTLIELMILRKIELEDGGTELFQYSYPNYNVDFTIVTPSFLQFDIKLYNSDVPVQDSVIENTTTRYTTIHFDNIPAIKYEEESFIDKYRVRAEYTLAYNYTHSRMRINTTNNFVNQLYLNLHNWDKGFLKCMKKNLIGGADINKKMSPLEIITKTEYQLKDKPHLFKNINDYQAIVYIAETYKIPYKIIISCDKTSRSFDKDYNGTRFYEDIIFYFPELDYYLSPTMRTYRNGMIPYLYSGNTGMYLEPITIEKTKSYLAEYDIIPIKGSDYSADTTRINVRMDLNKKVVNGTLYRSLTGYQSNFLQNYFYNFELEERESVIEFYLGLSSENTIVSKEEISNDKPEFIGIAPMIMKANVSSAEWIRVSPDEVIFKVGKLIGKQSKIEDKEARQLPVEKNYCSHYYREITFEIPEGYEIENLSDLNQEIYDSDEVEKSQAAFISSYTKEGNTITVICKEYYQRLFYPAKEFEYLKRVTNAAAEYNNLKLILHKRN